MEKIINMIQTQYIHERPDYTHNLFSEMKEFYDTEILPLAESFGIQRNPYPQSDPRHHEWQREYFFWKTNNPQKQII